MNGIILWYYCTWVQLVYKKVHAKIMISRTLIIYLNYILCKYLYLAYIIGHASPAHKTTVGGSGRSIVREITTVGGSGRSIVREIIDTTSYVSKVSMVSYIQYRMASYHATHTAPVCPSMVLKIATILT